MLNLTNSLKVPNHPISKCQILAFLLLQWVFLLEYKSAATWCTCIKKVMLCIINLANSLDQENPMAGLVIKDTSNIYSTKRVNC